jgi:hypothetical protein
MKITSKKIAALCFGVVLGLNVAAQADVVTKVTTIKTETHTKPNYQSDVNYIDFSVLDYNQDGVYSMDEVGDQLFRSFDRDRNELIDNIEWERQTVLINIPMEKETYRYVYYSDDGRPDEQTYTHENFTKKSGLARFSEDENGLSAKEFIGRSFNDLDMNNDRFLGKTEWARAYRESIKEPMQHLKRSNYN